MLAKASKTQAARYMHHHGSGKLWTGGVGLGGGRSSAVVARDGGMLLRRRREEVDPVQPSRGKIQTSGLVPLTHT
jgi:hypothetical protein